MKSISSLIHLGKKAHEVGLEESEYIARRELIDEFINSNEWDENAFIVWLLSKGNIAIAGGKYLDSHMWIKSSESKLPDSDKPTTKMPSIKKQAEGFMDSAKKVIKSKARFIDKDEYDKRMEECSSCEFIKKGRCSKCGCYMNIKGKFKSMSCPIDKW